MEQNILCQRVAVFTHDIQTGLTSFITISLWDEKGENNDFKQQASFLKSCNSLFLCNFNLFFPSKLCLAKLKNFHKVHVKILKPFILYKMLA